MADLFETFAKALKPVSDCEECNGTGTVCYSCCGDDIKGNDIDLCPTCLEHCDLEEEICESCLGTGKSND